MKITDLLKTISELSTQEENQEIKDHYARVIYSDIARMGYQSSFNIFDTDRQLQNETDQVKREQLVNAQSTEIKLNEDCEQLLKLLSMFYDIGVKAQPESQV